MKRNKFIVVLLLIIFLFFLFRTGWKAMGLSLDLIETGSSENIETPSEPQMQVLNEGADTGTGPTKVGSVSINPGGVTSIKIESGYSAAGE